jgi:hypothetical protein
MKDPAIWSRLQLQSFEPVGSLPFDRWVSEELGLSKRKSLLAVEEYRRMLYLLNLTDRPLTLPPVLAGIRSARVDAGESDSSFGVVEEHLPRSSPKMALSYAETIEIYRAEFGKPLSRKVWPHPFFLAAGVLAGNVFGICLVLGFFAGVAGFLAGAKPLMLVANICIMICVGCMVWIWILGPWGVLVTKADGG